MVKSIFEYKCKSYRKWRGILLIATINGWQKLFRRDGYKDLIIRSSAYLRADGKSEVFAFVHMPKHIQLIWRFVENNKCDLLF
ncbi:hypothetical protein SanaruYs_06540 [Chryseotalea sanaruensis]|uniref:Transposase IS200-like domain-containing protein n=1 Tax=Chryseotalea sanaruensis TaxID=2482724 RepID=A0A401U6E2_9BACT|nr:hypothetical protein SanaruYs_06540 [Chryseotalea sanaruensis]